MKTVRTFLVPPVMVSMALCALALFLPEAVAQNPQKAQKVAEIKQASAANKQALARYTWQEQQVVSLKG
jgi:poly-D-alanine transfer protein DltD